jgi:hypothetical protein
MFLEIKGADSAGVARTRSWHLLAEGADGPLIPAMAVQAIVLKHLGGMPPRIGARACVDDVELEDYERLFEQRAIYSGERTAQSPGAPLYRRILADAWERLPPAVRAMHDRVAEARGEARVERGRHPLAWLAARALSFPPAGACTPLHVRFERRGHEEKWTRSFGSHGFASRQYEGAGKWQCLLVERFGVLQFAMALVVDGDRLQLVMRHWSAFGVGLPKWLAPRSVAFETEENGAFRFFVEISHPFCGLIVRYDGRLTPS